MNRKTSFARFALPRIGLSLPIFLITAFILSVSGFNLSVITGFIMGMVICLLVDMMLINKEERQERIRKFFEVMFQNASSIFACAVLVSLTAFFMSNRAVPEDPFILTLYNTLPVFTTFVFALSLALMVVSMLISTVHYGVYQAKNFIFSVLYFAALAAGAQWVVGRYGDYVKDYSVSNPEASALWVLLGLISILITMLSFKLAPREQTAELVGYSSAGTAHLRSIGGAKLSARDAKYTAAHESGHMLVYAALDDLPPSIEMVINDGSSMSRQIGYVSLGVNSQHRLQEKGLAEWYMLVFLAGKIGEEYVLGESTLGSTEDHQRWLSLATQYLQVHGEGIFYPDPRNRLEQESNEIKLEQLKRSQKALLDQLFSQNEHILIAMSAALLEKRRMTKEDVEPYLSKVVLPEGFPKPQGAFAEFENDQSEAHSD